MNNQAILSDIKHQLIGSGELSLAQRQFLIDAFSRFEEGESLEEAFAKAELPCIKRGKQSEAYKEALQLRNVRLLIALSYMDGPSDWKKCAQLADLTVRVLRLIKDGGFQPASEPEKILLRIIESGTRPPTTQRRVFDAVCRKIKPD